MKESTNGPLKNYLLLSNGKKRDRCIKIEEGKKWEFMIVMIQSKVTQQRTKKKKWKGKEGWRKIGGTKVEG